MLLKCNQPFKRITIAGALLRHHNHLPLGQLLNDFTRRFGVHEHHNRRQGSSFN